MSGRLEIPVRAAASSADAVRGAEIVCAATTASQPVLFGADLSPGTHVNAIGANHVRKRELDDEAVLRADVVVVDSIEQSRQEAGDLVLGFATDGARWDGVLELAQVVAGKAAARRSESQVTLFKSNGIAAWDLAAATRVYAEVTKRKMGHSLPLWRTAS
jgi:ornithine cyclodeaminase/alanine dehydrogenase-like protein (mu-crystallin family)